MLFSPLLRSIIPKNVEVAEKIDPKISEFLKVFNDKKADTLKYFSWFDKINQANNLENSDKFFADFFYT